MQYRNVLLLALSQAVLMTGTSVLMATSALVGRVLSDSPTLATIPLGLQFLAMTAVTIPVSLFMQRHGRRAGFLIGIVLGICGALLASYAVAQDSYLIFCAASVLVGAFNGSGQFFRFAAADVAEPSRKAQAISLVMAGGIAAGFLGPNLAAWTRPLLEAEFAGSYLVLAALYVLGMAVISLLRVPLPPRGARAGGGRSLLKIARQPRFVVAVLTATVGYGVMNVLMAATPLSMNGHHHGFPDVAFVLQWHVLAMFIPSFFTGRLVTRFGLFNIMTTGVFAMFACVAINWSGNGVWHYWAGLFALGIGWNFMFIGGTTLLTETYTESEKAKAQACNDFIVFGTVTMTALSSGGLLNALGWQSLNLAVLPFLAAVLAGLGWLRFGSRGASGPVASLAD